MNPLAPTPTESLGVPKRRLVPTGQRTARPNNSQYRRRSGARRAGHVRVTFGNGTTTSERRDPHTRADPARARRRPTSDPDAAPPEPIWHGALADPTALSENALQQAHALADAARDGNWVTITGILDAPRAAWTVNMWRPGATTRYTPLHQAAWHGVPRSVIYNLIGRGAWRTQRTANGLTAHDIAPQRGHDTTAELLQPTPRRPFDADKAAVLDRHLAGLIESRIRPQLSVKLTHPQSSVLTEMPENTRLRYPIPGMYGGFSIQLMRGYLYTESWSRVVGGSGQAHVITTDGTSLVNEGFV